MQNNVLITGGSGYLGGTLLNRLRNACLPEHSLFALVRTDAQSQAVKEYGAEPVNFDVKDSGSIKNNILKYEINIVFFLIDAFQSESQLAFIRALAELKKTTGQDVHFLHTSGAKMFSSHAGFPTDRIVYDDDPTLFELHKGQQPPISVAKIALNTNISIVEESERLGVHSYIFVPCIVYGKGEGFGNKTSIQTVAIVKAAKAVGRVCKIDSENTSWPVSHVADTVMLYIQMLRMMLEKHKLPYGRDGFYLAASGSVHWDDVYRSMAAAMARRGIIHDLQVGPADDPAMEKMATALDCSKDLIPLELSGQCSFSARHGSNIDWHSQYSAESIFDNLDGEVDLILSTLSQ